MEDFNLCKLTQEGLIRVAHVRDFFVLDLYWLCKIPTDIETQWKSFVMEDLEGGKYVSPEEIFRPITSICPYIGFKEGKVIVGIFSFKQKEKLNEVILKGPIRDEMRLYLSLIKNF